jgi:hypothetical protein
VIDAQLGERLAAFDERRGGLPGVEAGGDGLLDLLVGATDRGAQLFQHAELVAGGGAAVGMSKTLHMSA